MAIIKEEPYIDENGQAHENFVRQYSDEGKQLLQVETGRVYDEAIDVVPCKYTYEELVEQEPSPTEEGDVIVQATEGLEQEALDSESSEAATEADEDPIDKSLYSNFLKGLSS